MSTLKKASRVRLADVGKRITFTATCGAVITDTLRSVHAHAPGVGLSKPDLWFEMEHVSRGGDLLAKGAIYANLFSVSPDSDVWVGVPE